MRFSVATLRLVRFDSSVFFWKAPKFPISAKDILLLGVPEGPLVGEILSEVEDWWIESDFIDDKASLFERIKAIVGAKI